MKKNNKKIDNRPTLVAFLLDRSGSMAACQIETIKGFNGYIQKLREEADNNIRMTFTQFDSIGIDTLYDCSKLDEIIPINDKTFVPRGNTPLYDAIGKVVRDTEKQESKYKILFVTLTDGENNSSTDWNLDTVKNLIKEKEDKNQWTFAHIGVGVNGWAAVQAYSSGTLSSANTVNYNSADTDKAYHRLANSTVRYADGQSYGVKTDFWAEPKT